MSRERDHGGRSNGASGDMGPPRDRGERSSVRRSVEREAARRSADRDSSDRDIKRRRERGGGEPEREKSPVLDRWCENECSAMFAN